MANGGLIDCAGSVTGGKAVISGGGILDFGAASTATTTFATRLAAQRHEGTTDLTNGLAVVLTEIRNGLEVRRQLSGQPDQLNITLALTLKASARRNTIEIAVMSVVSG